MVEAAGARFVVCPSPVVRKSHLSPRGLLALAAAVGRGIGPMTRLVREVRPDVLYVNTLSIPMWLVVAAAMRIPSVNHVHEAEMSVNPLARWGLELPTRLARRVVFNSETSRAAVRVGKGRAARGSRVVYNGVAGPPEVASRSPPTSTCPASRTSVVCPHGRVWTSPVDAVAELARRGVSASLRVVGDTFPGYEWYERELREQVEVERADVRRLLHRVS